MKKVIRAGLDIYSTFRGREAKRIRHVDYDLPVAVAVIGHVDYIGYRTTYDGKSELYEHEFAPGSRPLMCVNPDGRQLVLLGGRYVFDKDHGIVDKDAKGRKILDPDHGKDIGFMRVRQANPGGRMRGRNWKLADIDFNNQAYRGYMIRKNSLTGQMWIEKGGHLIGRIPDQHSWEWARKEIDGLLDETPRRGNPGPALMNPGEDGPLRQKDVFAAIRQMGLTVKKTGYGDEIRVAYKSGNAKRDEDSAYYTDDLGDALGTARAMVKAWNARHG